MIKNKKLEIAKKNLKRADILIKINNTSVVKNTIISVMKSIPAIGDVLDISITSKLNSFQERKRNELIDLILSDNNNITSEMVNDVEFILNFAKILDVVNKLATNDKIKYLASLLKNGYFSDEKIDNNNFEEYLDTINKLSNRDIEYLVVIYNFESKGIPFDNKYYYKFREEIISKFNNLDNNGVYDACLRLTGLGLLEMCYEVCNGQVSYSSSDGYEISKSELDLDCFILTTWTKKFLEMIMTI